MTSEDQIRQLVTTRAEATVDLCDLFLRLLAGIDDKPGGLGKARRKVARLREKAVALEDTVAIRAPAAWLIELQETAIAEGEADAYGKAAGFVEDLTGAAVQGMVSVENVLQEALRMSGRRHEADQRVRAGQEVEEFTETEPGG